VPALAGATDVVDGLGAAVLQAAKMIAIDASDAARTGPRERCCQGVTVAPPIRGSKSCRFS